jgi:exodeoxyribonuclease V alpha subunit
MDATELTTLEGRVADVLFHNPQNFYTVFVLDDGQEETPVLCEYPGLVVGEVLRVAGSYVQHPEYGRQLRALSVEQVRPVGETAILDYLSGGAVKGIGPATARRLVSHFGDRVLDILEQEPERLCEIKGITPKRAQRMAESYALVHGVRSVIAFVARFGLDASVGIACYKLWQNTAVAQLTADPYLLCGEHIGLDFETADRIAAHLDISGEDARRVRGGLGYVLRHNLQNGHACLPADKLIPAACRLLDCQTDTAEMVLDGMVEDGILIALERGERRYIYIPAQYEAERYIAGRLALMLAQPDPEETVDDTEIAAVEQELGIRYSNRQREALITALGSPVFVLTGGPGTGKTTALNGLLRLLRRRGYKSALAAPTGRAAKRMGEVTGLEAKTIHRLLEASFSDGEGCLKFRRCSQNPLDCDVLILDEVSMVDTLLFEAALRALRLGSRLVLVGDSDQLPSVGAGNLLWDVIASGRVPTVHLSEVFRQAAQSRIVTTAHSVVRGEGLDLATRPDSDLFFVRRATAADAAETVLSLCQRRLPDTYGFSPLTDIQVITPTRQGGVGTVQLNALLQQHLNPPAPDKGEVRFGSMLFREGDKVMQIKNNYDVEWQSSTGEKGLGIYNGDIGLITLIDRPSRSMLIQFDDREVQYLFDNLNQLELAYAITVHKSQGNEFDAVVMPLVGSHRHLHYRNLLYTGMTRAKKLLVMVGHPSTAQQMAANNRGGRRYTNLAWMLEREGM